MCSNQVPIETSCPEGTIFDETAKVCNHPNHVKLPADYCEYTDIWYEKAHKCDCKKYVMCYFGTATVFECPIGYHRNPKHVINYVRFGYNVQSVCKIGNCTVEN